MDPDNGRSRGPQPTSEQKVIDAYAPRAGEGCIKEAAAHRDVLIEVDHGVLVMEITVASDGGGDAPACEDDRAAPESKPDQEAPSDYHLDQDRYCISQGGDRQTQAVERLNCLVGVGDFSNAEPYENYAEQKPGQERGEVKSGRFRHRSSSCSTRTIVSPFSFRK